MSARFLPASLACTVALLAGLVHHAAAQSCPRARTHEAQHTLILVTPRIIVAEEEECPAVPACCRDRCPRACGAMWPAACAEERSGKAPACPAPVLPPLRDGGPLPGCAEPPTDEEVLAALPPLRRGIPLLYEELRADVEIVRERLPDEVEPPAVYPLVGRARLHRVPWKCTVHFNETIRGWYPFPFEHKTPRVEVVCIGKEHLHACEPELADGSAVAHPCLQEQDADQLLAEARKALEQGGCDRAAALANEAKQAGFHAIFPWSDTPDKVLKDVQKARTKQKGAADNPGGTAKQSTSTNQASIAHADKNQRKRSAAGDKSARREAKVVKLVARYHEACAEGRLDDARVLAAKALALDPACFSKE
jgi:hypothetical protein